MPSFVFLEPNCKSTNENPQNKKEQKKSQAKRSATAPTDISDSDTSSDYSSSPEDLLERHYKKKKLNGRQNH